MAYWYYLGLEFSWIDRNNDNSLSWRITIVYGGMRENPFGENTCFFFWPYLSVIETFWRVRCTLAASDRLVLTSGQLPPPVYGTSLLIVTLFLITTLIMLPSITVVLQMFSLFSWAFKLQVKAWLIKSTRYSSTTQVLPVPPHGVQRSEPVFI